MKYLCKSRYGSTNQYSSAATFEKFTFLAMSSSYYSFKACTTLGGNSCHQWWIQGGEAFRLHRQIPRLFLLSPGLVSNIWHTHRFINIVRISAFSYVFVLIFLQHICLSHGDHCIRRPRAWVSCHQHGGGRLLCWLPVHSSGLVSLQLVRAIHWNDWSYTGSLVR